MKFRERIFIILYDTYIEYSLCSITLKCEFYRKNRLQRSSLNVWGHVEVINFNIFNPISISTTFEFYIFITQLTYFEY